MNTKYTRFAIAAVIYMVFAGYLYRPYFKGFGSGRLEDLFVLNVCLASLGTYVISRRWVDGFPESFFAGAVYGFGPFALGLAKFHPTAGFLFAAVPWLFCPAVFGPKGKYKPLRVPLSLLPFLAIVLFFQLAARFGLYPIPINLKIGCSDLAGLLAPLVGSKRNMILVGFYHIPVASLIMGFSMLLMPLEELLFTSYDLRMRLRRKLPGNEKSKIVNHKLLKGLAVRRFGIVAIFAVATILAFCQSFFDVSPIIWLAVSVLFCSVLIGAGMQGLISAGFADRKWILFTAIVMCILAIVTLLLATKYRVAGFQPAIRGRDALDTIAGLGAGYARLLTEEAKMYLLGAITISILFFTTRAKLRMHLLKVGLLCATMGLDIFLGARFVVDAIL
jgi:hypothetical protein